MRSTSLVCVLLVVLFAADASARRLSFVTDTVGKGGLAKIAAAVGGLGEGYAGKNSTEVMEKLHSLTESVLERITNQEKHTAVVVPNLSGLLRGGAGPQILPGSPEDGSLVLPSGATAAVTVINNWDFKADHSELIAVANKYAALSPPCAIVLVAKNVTKSASTSGAPAPAPTAAAPTAPPAPPRFRARFSPVPSAQQAVAPSDAPAPSTAPGPSGLAFLKKGPAKKFIVVPQKTQQLKGLTIPNVYVVAQHKDMFIVLAAGDLSLPFGQKKAPSPGTAPSTPTAAAPATPPPTSPTAAL